eukprot:361367-Chlamydomonas_euryale.AAC.10
MLACMPAGPREVAPRRRFYGFTFSAFRPLPLRQASALVDNAVCEPRVCRRYSSGPCDRPWVATCQLPHTTRGSLLPCGARGRRSLARGPRRPKQPPLRCCSWLARGGRSSNGWQRRGERRLIAERRRGARRGAEVGCSRWGPGQRQCSRP